MGMGMSNPGMVGAPMGAPMGMGMPMMNPMGMGMGMGNPGGGMMGNPMGMNMPMNTGAGFDPRMSQLDPGVQPPNPKDAQLDEHELRCRTRHLVLAMGLEDLRVPVQGLRSDQGLMDADNIRIRIDTDCYTPTPLLCSLTWHESFHIASFLDGTCSMLGSPCLRFCEVQGYLSYHPQLIILKNVVGVMDVSRAAT